MAGGLAVISDVPKTLVYRLARAVNADSVAGAGSPPIPESTLTKPPSAELRPDQTDQDTLPPYDLLDAILEAHLVEGLDAAALVGRGFAAAVVDDVASPRPHQRIQAPPDAPRPQDHGQGVRSGTPLSDRPSGGLTRGDLYEIRGQPLRDLLYGEHSLYGPRSSRRRSTKNMRAAITVLPGDGIGPEVVAQATRVLSAVGERWGHTFSLREALIGGAAIDQTGNGAAARDAGDRPRDRRGAAGRGGRARSGTIRAPRFAPSRGCSRSARGSGCTPICGP